MDITQIIYITILFLAVWLGKYFLKTLYIGYKLTSPIKFKEVDIKERYSKTKIPKQIDYVIIGAGTSGLTCGALLSKLGYKVLVLESLGKAGGSMHTFGKDGVSFDTGFHYIGNEKSTKTLIDQLSAKKIDWKVHQHYDTIKLGNETFDFKAPQNEFFSYLTEKFPESKEQIQTYRHYCTQSMKLFFWMNQFVYFPRSLLFILETFLKKYYKNIYGKSTLQIFDEIGISKNKKLAFLLNLTPCGGLGATSEELPFVLHAKYICQFNRNGSMYPVGGPKSIVEGLVSTIVQRGGTLLVKARVEEILVENNCVVGMRLCDNNEVKCKNIISTAGIYNTIKMVPEKSKEILEGSFPSTKSQQEDFSLYSKFYGVNIKDLEESQKPTAANVWCVPGAKDSFEKTSFDDFEKKFLQSQDFSKMWSYIAFQTTKEESDNEIVSVCHLGRGSYAQVEQFRVNEKQRKEGYQEYKDKVDEAMQKVFFEQYPQFKDRIVKEKFGTPLTIENYLNRTQPYGQQITTDKFFDIYKMFQTRTPIYGLHLSGHDISYAGIKSAMKMGSITALRASNYF